MGLKKYDENEVKNIEKAEEDKIIEEKKASEVSKEKTHEEIINSIIDENTKLEEEESKISINEDETAFVNQINEKRSVYLKQYKKIQFWNKVVTFTVLGLIVIAFALFLIFQNQIGNYGWIIFGVMILFVVGSAVYSSLAKKKLNGYAQIYINDLFKMTAEFVFKGEDFKDTKFLGDTQLQDDSFIKCHFYKNIKGCRSRNYCVTTYKDKELTSVDMAANVLVKNKLAPMFLGKFYAYPNDFNEENQYIIFQLKGGELSRPIDDIDNIPLVEGNDRYVVYSNIEKYKQIMPQKALNVLKKFRIDKTLIDVIVCIRKGYTCVGIDYSDEFLNIPVEKDFNIQPVRRTVSDLNLVREFLDNLKF